jgi:hypothetical protein
VLNLGAFPGLTFVQRLRLPDDAVEQTYREVRAIVADRKHYNTTWWIDDRATPPDLTERLLALGLRFGEEPRFEPHGTGMALLKQPPAVEGVTARAAETLEEWNLAAEIGNEIFGVPEEDREAQRKTSAARFEAQRKEGGGTRFLAWVDGRPAASATVVWAPLGGLCLGGATCEWARGRGAYRALVRARWDAAVARGTAALVVNAGRMSRPILERLGFVAVAELDVLVGDDFR